MPKGSNTNMPAFSHDGFRHGVCVGCTRINKRIRTRVGQKHELTWKCDICGTENTWHPPVKTTKQSSDGTEVAGWKFGPQVAMWTAEEVD